MEMDELRVSSKFMRGIITKMVSKMIYKKLGYKVNIELNGIEVKVIDGMAHLHLDVDAEINKDELMKVIKSVGLD